VGAVHVDDPVIRVVVGVAHRIVAVARLALVGIRLDVHIPAAAATVLVALGIAAIGPIALTPVQRVTHRVAAPRVTSRMGVQLTHASRRAAGVGH